jgi:predicted RecB family nuclease
VRLLDEHLLLSASDLINFLECEHLTALDVQLADGRILEAPGRADTAELVARKGDEHEQRYLESLRETHGDALVEIDTSDGSYEGLQASAQRTREAMEAGAPVIYQAAFVQNEWMGYADFLERKDDRPSQLGDWSYEAVDTKLARSLKPYFVIQLCLYSGFIAEIQGTPPLNMHVILGTGERETLLLADFSAYYRRMSKHFAERLETGLTSTYPEPVDHCSLCKWAERCKATRAADDHLSLVARLSRSQGAKLRSNGISTVAQLAKANELDRPTGMGTEAFERVRQQAQLQVYQRETGKLARQLLPPEPPGDGPLRGFALLPEPSEGDVFFDIEGDPFYEDGLEYLWGITYFSHEQAVFKPFWGKERATEKLAFEDFIDFVSGRRTAFPDMHIYHYAPYEPTALKRMMGLHGTREQQVDRLLREHVLVDLYRVVEQALRISRPSYSIKEVEAFYMGKRTAAVQQAGDSVLMFEEWLQNGSQQLLDDIEAYNKEDCDSTLLLRNWLLEQKELAEQQHGMQIAWRMPGKTKRKESLDAEAEENEAAKSAALQVGLLDGVPDDRHERTPEQQHRWLLAQLLEYHRREDKPGWWEYFDRLERSDSELTEMDSESIGGLEPVGEPEKLGGRSPSMVQQLTFPTQEHKIKVGAYDDPHSCGIDPDTGESDQNPETIDVVSIDDENGTIGVKVTPKWSKLPLPTALIPRGPMQTGIHRAALRDVASDIVKAGLEGEGKYRAARDVLRRDPPRTSAVELGSPLQEGEVDLEKVKRIARGLDGSCLFIQGPPGSGKTYTGAHLILDLIASGATIGVTSNSHKAISNLLHEVEKFAGPSSFRGLKKSSSSEQDFISRLPKALIGNSSANKEFPPGPEVQLIAGTSWLWCRESMRASVDYLVVDEAGQISLADTLAISTAATNLILLGDPMQLSQVSRGTHPRGAGASVLEHLLGDHSTIPPERGVFLDHTRRMHPDVCEFISDAVYDGRLLSDPDCAKQAIEAAGAAGAAGGAAEGALPAEPGQVRGAAQAIEPGQVTGTGVRSISIDHEGNSRQSPEEAARIATEIAGLVGARYTKKDGTETALEAKHVMVVTPYNAQVRCLRQQLDLRELGDVAVGTVDKFQGQEAAIVFFSMATSSGGEIPRNVEFLYSRKRLNVAISRARCIGVLVASPALLTIRCHTVEQMRLVNALCLLDEKAVEQTAIAATA